MATHKSCGIQLVMLQSGGWYDPCHFAPILGLSYSDAYVLGIVISLLSECIRASIVVPVCVADPDVPIPKDKVSSVLNELPKGVVSGSLSHQTVESIE